MKKSTRILISILVGILLISGTFSAGVLVGNLVLPKADLGWFDRTPEITLAETGDSSDPENTLSEEELFKPFWESWDIVHDQFIDQPVDDTALMRGAIIGMLESLGDDHTGYMDPDQLIQANIPMDGEYEGIGAWVDTTTEYLTIISPMPDSPAEEAGLLPGDEVLKIDGEDMTGLDGSVVIRSILGPAGSEVVLTIRREGIADPFDVNIIREKIVVPSVISEILENEIGYVQLTSFAQETDDDLRNQLEEILTENPVGLIVDLRNNGGGYLQTAVNVASEFIADGVVLYEDYGSDEELVEFEASGNGLATEIPIVVLINEGSASASEILAGAIQDYDRGPLIGMTSFGKGSVQNWIELTDQQGAVRVTIARWLTPDKRQINQQGLTPDIEVEFTEDDFLADLDPQLDKAIEVLMDLVEN